MIKRLIALAFAAAATLCSSVALAAGGGPLLDSQVNINDKSSLQRGAALFMSYCAGCHSLGYQRYSRTAKDLGLSEEQVMSYLNFTGAKFGEHMKASMDPADGAVWFGKAPPDLSLVARAKPGGPNWTYTFLKSFYVDETRPAGWNNTVLAGASMPNVLWGLQGIQRPTYGEHGEIAGFELAPAGSQTPEEFDRTIRDITAFLTYVGEPAALKREAYGVWVILFLAVFTFLAWLLKTEYWRDVH
ncbi:cytochrome c1 [Aquimonas sp.]|jgi:ubiquinol-cytochrome c reductase cytochrome c1 subunit|uniref:cytochrome c1 n=1 Tax=Aquimonas sp. TaxID=1872588 RepID=UPI0037BE8317